LAIGDLYHFVVASHYCRGHNNSGSEFGIVIRVSQQ